MLRRMTAPRALGVSTLVIFGMLATSTSNAASRSQTIMEAAVMQALIEEAVEKELTKPREAEAYVAPSDEVLPEDLANREKKIAARIQFWTQQHRIYNKSENPGLIDRWKIRRRAESEVHEVERQRVELSKSMDRRLAKQDGQDAARREQADRVDPAPQQPVHIREETAQGPLVYGVIVRDPGGQQLLGELRVVERGDRETFEGFKGAFRFANDTKPTIVASFILIKRLGEQDPLPVTTSYFEPNEYLTYLPGQALEFSVRRR